MPSRKPKKFCRLTKYLEAIDKDLHQTLDDLCLFSLFSLRGKRGVTFLYPTDKAYRKKIIDLAYSNTPEKAIDMIKALVLMDYLPKPVDFKNKKDDIPNSLRKKVEVEDADNTSVKLKGGFKLTLASDFIPMRSDDAVCVYKLTGKGELPVSGVPSNMKYSQGTSGGYRGGAESSSKKAINDFVERTYINDPRCKLVYKFIMGAVYKAVLENNNDDEIMKIYSGLCASARAEYYLIVAPFANVNPYWDNENSILQNINSIISNNDAWNRFCENSVSNYNTNRDEIITKVRSGKSYESLTFPVYQKQDDIIKSVTEPSLYKSAVTTAYNTDTNKLSKDLLTVYCYLASCSEWDDPNYYQNCFLYVMKNIFNDPMSLSSSSNDLAHNITLYANLLKSDAFLYVPHLSTDTRDVRFVDINEFPEPTFKQKLFTIIGSRKMAVYGGDDEAVTSLFGGVGASHMSVLS